MDEPTIHPDAAHPTPAVGPSSPVESTTHDAAPARRVDPVALVAGVLALLVAGGATVGRGLLPGGLPDPRWVPVLVVLLAGIGIVTRAVRRR